MNSKFQDNPKLSTYFVDILDASGYVVYSAQICYREDYDGSLPYWVVRETFTLNSEVTIR